MLNYAIGRDIDDMRDLKALGNRLVRALAEAVEAGGWEAPPLGVEETWRGRRLAWRLQGRADSPCPDCAGDRLAYAPDGEGAACDFCPACWSLAGSEPSGTASFRAALWLDKRLRDLPPGLTMKMSVAGERLPVGPEPPANEAERRAALLAYAKAAERPLEIGRQVWMAQMRFEGTNGVRQDYGEARRWFEKAATWASGEALTRLGLMALHGLGGPEDEARAVSLCRRAAERGYPAAQTGMGRLCWDGIGVPEDLAAAVAWWRPAAERKDREAQLWLANALLRGLGGVDDPREGMSLLEEAAEAGYVDAQAFLGKVLLGAGKQDEPEAVAWLTKAAAAGHDGAQWLLEKAGREGGGAGG